MGTTEASSKNLSTPEIRPRLFFIDNLRIGLIALVVAHHAGQAYGPTGGWWYIINPERASVLGAFFTVNRSFFMSLFFMISGYFLPQSFDRKGRSFLGDRFSRLGIPLLVFFFVVIPVMMYAYHVSFRPYGPIPFISYYFHFYFNHGVRPIGSVLLGRMRTLGICGSSNICSSSPSAIGCGD
jgi:peptidoglycan/LPS O-acetylase OafA/YrhL